MISSAYCILMTCQALFQAFSTFYFTKSSQGLNGTNTIVHLKWQEETETQEAK